MTDELVGLQKARHDEGFDIIEWECRDGSGSWQICEPYQSTQIVAEIKDKGWRVWLNGEIVL